MEVLAQAVEKANERFFPMGSKLSGELDCKLKKKRRANDQQRSRQRRKESRAN